MYGHSTTRPPQQLMIYLLVTTIFSDYIWRKSTRIWADFYFSLAKGVSVWCWISLYNLHMTELASQSFGETWRKHSLSSNLAGDVLAALLSSTLISPILTAIDRSVNSLTFITISYWQVIEPLSRMSPLLIVPYQSLWRKTYSVPSDTHAVSSLQNPSSTCGRSMQSPTPPQMAWTASPKLSWTRLTKSSQIPLLFLPRVLSTYPWV